MTPIEKTIRDRLAETGKTLTEEEIAALVARMDKAGPQIMAGVGQAAIYTQHLASQHLKALGK